MVSIPKGFRQVQSARGVRSGKARMAASAEKQTEALALASEGRTQAYIANALGVNQATICRWLKKTTS
jgi:DNA-binding transcriptional regulator LsrR (DeoR family)